MRGRTRPVPWPLVILAWGGSALAVIWGAVLVRAEGSLTRALQLLSDGLLYGVSLLAQSVLSGWFLLAVAITPVALRLVRDLLPRARRVEVGQIRLELLQPDLADLAFRIGPPAQPLEEWAAIPKQEVLGSDGPILDEPPSSEAYQACMAALPVLFQDLSGENQSAKAEALIQLESGWAGEFLPELAASVSYLRVHARRNRVVLEGYLSITLLFRHLMLFFYGRHEHAAHLAQDLDLLSLRDRMGFLRRPVMLWVLLALCRQKRWAEIETLLRHMEPYSLEHAAVRAHGELARGHTGESIAAATAALHDQPGTSPFHALLLVTLGRALLEEGRPLEAIEPVRRLLETSLPDDSGLATPLRAVARQVLARSATLLNWHEPLYALYGADPEARQDPFLLHALAVLTGRAGQVQQARHLIRQAEALVPAGGEILARAIREAAQWLG